MNIKLLKEVIKHIKKHVRCPGCDREYRNNNIFILGATPEHAFFHLQCKPCKTNLLLNTAVQNTRKQRKIKLEKHDPNELHPVVSKDEVLDMHNFLKDFDGNFRKQFKKTK